MDQGVAALVGAVVGAAGATAAALITVRSSARGVLAQLQQQSAQFTRQGLVDQVRTRRDARRVGYAAFAECFYGFMETVGRAHEVAEAGDAASALALIKEDGSDAHGRLLRARAVLAIEGPPYVTAAAETVADRIHIWMELRLRIAGVSRQSLGAAEYASIESDFRTDFRTFTEACNRALDDEGSGSVS
ncbi:hypothetical protein ABZZ44_11075 [Streptomyces sp. NPDC006460]|uniref:hypothetical protein n=1 Tax=Streptomyces sp. NPDC006460 TaxID=3154304 RepID=UPI00339F469E